MILAREGQSKTSIDLWSKPLWETARPDEILFIVPTRRKMRSLKREIIATLRPGDFPNIEIETIETISTGLLKRHTSFRNLSDGVSYFLIEQGLKTLKLRTFSGFREFYPSGTLEKIRRIFYELKRNDISPADLSKEAESIRHESLKNKFSDYQALYNDYIIRTRSVGNYEIGDVYHRLINIPDDSFHSIFRQSYANVRYIMIIGFDEFSSPETVIIQKMSLVPNVELSLNFDYFSNNHTLFSHLNDCYQRLNRAGFEKISESVPHTLRTFNSFLKESLFNSGSGIKNKSFADKIFILKQNDRYSEVSTICGKIKLMLAAGRVNPDEICVVFNNIGKYSPLIRELFDEYGIPFNLTDRQSVETCPPVKAILNALEMFNDNFYYKSVMRFLHHGLINSENIDRRNLILTAKELRITAGADIWTRKIREAIAAVKEDPANAPEDRERKEKRLKKALRDVNYLANLTDVFNGSLSPLEFKEAIHGLIKNLDLHKSVFSHDRLTTELNIRGLSAFLDILDESLSLLESEDNTGIKHNFSFYLDVIRTIARRTRHNVKEEPGYGVLITAPDEIRGLEFDHLFIGGLTDGDFPARYSPELFSPETLKRNEKRHLQDQRYHFYQLLSSWKKSLHLSRPINDGKRSLTESGFLKELLEIFEVTEFTLPDQYIFTDKDKQLYQSSKQTFDHKNPALLSEEKIVSAFLDRKNGLNVVSPFTGYTFPEPGYKKVEKQFSITALEMYLNCPFKYFMQYVLRVETPEDPKEEFEPKEYGDLLHEILFRLSEKLRAESIILGGCSEDFFNKAIDYIFAIAYEVADEKKFDRILNFGDSEKIFGYKGERKNSLLYKFIETERNDSEFIPSYFEVAFGRLSRNRTDTQLYSSEPIEIGGVKFRGKIDRIDLKKSNGGFRIVDYKTGYMKTQREINELKYIQLPLYAAVAGKLLKEKNGLDAEGSFGFYSLKYNAEEFGFHARNIPDYNGESGDWYEYFFSKISEAVENISDGKFPLTGIKNPEGTICKYCGYKTVCRIKELEN